MKLTLSDTLAKATMKLVPSSAIIFRHSASDVVSSSFECRKAFINISHPLFS